MKKKLLKSLETEIASTGNREDVIADFENIKRNSGWLRVVEVLDRKVVEYDNTILNTDVQGEELNRLRDRRDLCLWFRNLPEILVESLGKEVNIKESLDLDPYDKIEIVDK